MPPLILTFIKNLKEFKCCFSKNLTIYWFYCENFRKFVSKNYHNVTRSI